MYACMRNCYHVKSQFNYYFVLHAGLVCASVCLSKHLSGPLLEYLLGACQTSYYVVCWHICQRICLGICRESVGTSLRVSILAKHPLMYLVVDLSCHLLACLLSHLPGIYQFKLHNVYGNFKFLVCMSH